MAKKVKAPKGAELKLEAPIKIKTDQMRRDLDNALERKSGAKKSYYGPDGTKKTVQNIRNTGKVKSAFELGKKTVKNNSKKK